MASMSKPKEEEEDGEGARGAEEEIREHWCWWLHAPVVFILHKRPHVNNVSQPSFPLS